MRIENEFIRNLFMIDHMSEVNWTLVRDTVLTSRRILGNPEKFPHADFDFLERTDLEGTSFLLQAPVQFIV